MRDGKTYYQILGVLPKAADAEVHSAYRRLVRTMHPDRIGATEENTQAFMKITEAGMVLTDSQKRGEYDLMLNLTTDRCDRCGGTGVTLGSFGAGTAKTCIQCGGAGLTLRVKK